MMNADQEFIALSLEEFRKYKAMGMKALEQVSEEKMHWSPDPESNSIAVIIRHLHGNMLSRFTDFLTTDGEKPTRHRDSEFEDSGESAAGLKRKWEEGWKVVLDAVEELKPEDVMRTVLIRNEPHTVMKAIIRQLTHYASHVGQIIYLAKMIAGENWQTLSIARGKSSDFNRKMGM
jgi:hypothetical protein